MTSKSRSPERSSRSPGTNATPCSEDSAESPDARRSSSSLRLSEQAGLPKFDDEPRSRLRVTLELWGVSVMPDGLSRLLVALIRDDPGGELGIGSWGG
jgi:hypothetical protein